MNERDAETVFVRGVTLRYEERAEFEGKVGDVARFVRGEWKPVTGVGVVAGLSGTGDRGDAFTRTQAFIQNHPDLRAPPDTDCGEGAVAMVMVEARIAMWLGRSAGLVGASVRPVGNAESLDGGMLLETDLLDPGEGEVWALAAGPVLVSRVDAGGRAVKTPKFGRIMKIEVKARFRPGEIRVLEFRPVWPELLEAVSLAVSEAFPAIRTEVELPNRVRLVLPDDPLALTLDFTERILGLPFHSGSGLLARVLCDEKKKRILAVGARLFLGRGSFLLGEGIKVVSMAPPGRPRPPTSTENRDLETDLAFIEVRKGEEIRRIMTLRWLSQIVRVLDRLGVPYAEVRKLIHMASESGVLPAELIDLSLGGVKTLKDNGEKVR